MQHAKQCNAKCIILHSWMPGSILMENFMKLVLPWLLWTRCDTKWTDWIIICCFQETKTQNWRANSEDIHLFQEQMEPYLMKMYPQTKVWCTLYNNIHSHFTAQCLENHLVYPPDKRWYKVWRPTKVNWEKLSEYLILKVNNWCQVTWASSGLSSKW